MASAHRILLVEDDPDEARLSRDVLAESGYVVCVANSARGAREAVVGEAPFDLVFLDLRLPDGDGLRLVPALRRAGVNAPVVLVTGDRSERIGQQAFQAGCADLAVKDLNYHLWLPKMAQALIPAASALDGGWGPHVLGVCLGRLQGDSMRCAPIDLWPGLSGALLAASDLAVRGLRAANASLLGSLPVVTLRMGERSLLFVRRGGDFGAAWLQSAPKPEDEAQLLALVVAYAQERTGSGDADRLDA